MARARKSAGLHLLVRISSKPYNRYEGKQTTKRQWRRWDWIYTKHVSENKRETYIQIPPPTPRPELSRNYVPVGQAHVKTQYNIHMVDYIRTGTWSAAVITAPPSALTFWRRNFFLSFSTPVYKMWIIQEPNMLKLWNKLHFEEKKKESIYHV